MRLSLRASVLIVVLFWWGVLTLLFGLSRPDNNLEIARQLDAFIFWVDLDLPADASIDVSWVNTLSYWLVVLMLCYWLSPVSCSCSALCVAGIYQIRQMA